MIRDEMGKWILRYNRFLRKSSIFVAELWRILDGLLLLQKQGHERWFIRHIRRKDNQVADTLAKIAFANWKKTSSLESQETLEEDIARGTLFPSSIL
ncbi:hypothetical protein Gohar_010456 [Gossypium harknessii]|uniref:RNase H type-1 domain-containing protein n=1 Tax=Gossypium harknessii TaxID=34285 RepID=A0A7J9GQY0_9ROSI|nr:hypothetical protein [Gossypium harknessii]